jgi:hypothetical protein
MKVLKVYENNGRTLTRMFLSSSDESSLIMTVLMELGYDCVPEKGEFTFKDAEKRKEAEHIRSARLIGEFNEATGGKYD